MRVIDVLIPAGDQCEIEMVDIDEGDSHAYYRENGVHYVPKLRLEELIL